MLEVFMLEGTVFLGSLASTGIGMFFACIKEWDALETNYTRLWMNYTRLNQSYYEARSVNCCDEKHALFDELSMLENRFEYLTANLDYYWLLIRLLALSLAFVTYCYFRLNKANQALECTVTESKDAFETKIREMSRDSRVTQEKQLDEAQKKHDDSLNKLRGNWRSERTSLLSEMGQLKRDLDGWKSRSMRLDTREAALAEGERGFEARINEKVKRELQARHVEIQALEKRRERLLQDLSLFFNTQCQVTMDERVQRLDGRIDSLRRVHDRDAAEIKSAVHESERTLSQQYGTVVAELVKSNGELASAAAAPRTVTNTCNVTVTKNYDLSSHYTDNSWNESTSIRHDEYGTNAMLFLTPGVSEENDTGEALEYDAAAAGM